LPDPPLRLAQAHIDANYNTGRARQRQPAANQPASYLRKRARIPGLNAPTAGRALVDGRRYG
jgi:hypothetical protein